MASTSETGIVKTIANLETLISYCNAVGPYYKPTKTSLTIAALKTLLNNAQGSQQFKDITTCTRKKVYSSSFNKKIQPKLDPFIITHNPTPLWLLVEQ